MHKSSPSPRIDRHVLDGDVLYLGQEKLRILHTPGHTPDQISILAGNYVFTGDSLLIQGTGRSDFAGGDAKQNYESVMEKLFTLPDHVVVLPGHDYHGRTKSTIGHEKESNPRMSLSKEEYEKLMDGLFSSKNLPHRIQEVLQINQVCIVSCISRFLLCTFHIAFLTCSYHLTWIIHTHVR